MLSWRPHDPEALHLAVDNGARSTRLIMAAWSLFDPPNDDPARLQQALRQSFDLLTLAEESAQIGIWDRDIATGMMRGTPTFFRLMGLPPHGGPVHMDVVRAVRHPEDAKRVVEGFESTLERGLDTYESEYRIIRPVDGKVRWIFGRGRTVRDAEGKPVRYSGVDIDITERKEAEENARRLMHEVNHRSNNLLAVVQALVHHTLNGSADPKTFGKRLSQRIAGIAASNAMLVSGQWQGVELDSLVYSQLKPFLADTTRLKLGGPPVRLKSTATQAVGMALHELATNATKYGALSTSEGAIDVAWWLSGGGPDKLFTMEWRESGGPIVAEPQRIGFGHVVMSQMLEMSLGGKARLSFPPAGAHWAFECPASAILD